MARGTAAALIALALIVIGCGEGGVGSGASVAVYVAKPQCSAAERELEKEGGRIGEVRVRVVCLPPVQNRGRVVLATAGANARRATEDSSAVAYLEAPGPAAEFSRSIVEAAEIAWLEAGSGATGMHRVLRALEGRGSTSPRTAVLDQVG